MPLTDAAKEQLPADRFAAFVKARDATLAAMEHTKKNIDEHAASWPENYAIGRAAYDAMLRDEKLLPFNSDDIERMGRDELAHGWAVQTWVEELAAERGTPIGPESGGGLAPGGAALIDYYRARIAQLREFVRQHHVVDVPEWLGETVVIETPKFMQPVSPGASMFSAAVVQQRHNRLLLHNPSDIACRGGEESGCQSGLRPRSHPLDGGARSDAGPLSAVVHRPATPGLRPQNPKQ